MKIRTDISKDEATDNLHKAVAEYVAANGGKVVVTSSIQVIQFPADSKFNWTLGVKCTGKKPKSTPPATA